jgi:hypothetical protein
VATRVALIVALLVVSARASAQTDRGRELFDRGAARAAARDYQGAAQDFEAAFAADGRKEALFAWAQAERLGGRCTMAIELYRRFLASGVTPAQREAADLNIRRCEREGDAAPPPVALPPPPPRVVVVKEPPTVVVAPAPVRSRRAVVTSAALAGGAMAALAASGTFFLLSRADERHALAVETTWDDYYGPARRARTRGLTALALLGGGVALAGAALGTWWLSAPGPVTAWVEPGGAGLAWAGRY